MLLAYEIDLDQRGSRREKRWVAVLVLPTPSKGDSPWRNHLNVAAGRDVRAAHLDAKASTRPRVKVMDKPDPPRHEGRLHQVTKELSRRQGDKDLTLDCASVFPHHRLRFRFAASALTFKRRRLASQNASSSPRKSAMA